MPTISMPSGLFADIRAAYDQLSRPLLWQTLEGLGMQGPMHGTIQSLYDSCLLSVNTSGTSDEGWMPGIVYDRA